MIKHRITLHCGIGGLLLTTLPVLAQDDTDIITKFATAQRNDVDFTTSTYTLGVKAKTPYGLVMCEYGAESGETRIDTFDNIFGNQSVLTTTWNGYDASLIRCGYGIKLPLAGGELSGGIGLLRYQGETDVAADGKEIDVDGFRLQTRYIHGDYDTRVKWVEKKFNYLYHHLSGGYDSITSGRIRTLSLEGDWGPVYAESEYLQGTKEKDFISPPLPLPYAEFDYQQFAVSLGPTFSGEAGPLRYIAPTYVSGSERGSFSSLSLDNGFRGIVAGLEFADTELRLSYLNNNSDGSRDYSPVTTDLAEAKSSSKLSAELKADDWSVKLENNRMTHDGYITVTSTPIPYTLLTGCLLASCSYNNVRQEDEWKLSWSYAYSARIELQGDLYQRQRKDTQFENAVRKYNESGGSVALSVTF